MSRNPSIVVGVDFSEDSAAAVGRAALLAEQFEGRLRLLHVLSPDDLQPVMADPALRPVMEERLLAFARRRLEGLLAPLPERVRQHATVAVAVGEVHEECVAAARTADLLVVGPRGTNPLRNLFIGSTADRLLRSSPCPVLVVKRSPTGPYASAVLPLDGPERAQDALAAAARWAPHAALVGVHAMRVPMESTLRLAGADEDAIARVRARARQEAAGRFAGLEPPTEPPGRWRLALAEGDPTPVILDVATAATADLVVIGRQGRAPWHEFLLGSVTRRVLATADCDVLVVPPHPVG
jgi:nucleotide-binding universal stress UspA family protein